MLGHVWNANAVTLLGSVGMWLKLDTIKLSDIAPISLDTHNTILITDVVFSEAQYNIYNVAHFHELMITDLTFWILRNQPVIMVAGSLSELVRHDKLVINAYLMVWELIPL